MRYLIVFLIPLFIIGCRNNSSPKYKDTSLSIDQRVEDLMKRMTLEEKIAQLYGGHIFDSLAWDNNGNFLGTADTATFKKGMGSVWIWNIGKTAEFNAKCFNSFQKYMVENSRLGIPVFIYAEALHGYMASGATSFPQAIALGSTWDTTLIEQVFTAASLEASARGVNQVLSPVIDLSRDPRWGRTEECYSEDPYLVSRIGLAAIYGLQGRSENIDNHHVAVTLKHFAGHGQPEGGRNIAPVNYSEREFRENHLYPFEMAVKKGKAHSVMASYNEWDGIPNHVNRKLLIDILQDEWGFYGYVMSDGGGIDVLFMDHHSAADSAEAGLQAINGGIDFELGGGGCFIGLKDRLNEGSVSIETIDRAVRNILRVKFLRGLFENPYADIELMKNITNGKEHKILARKAATEAMILLKNEGGILPFDSNKINTLAVIGPNASGIHLGGYSDTPMKGVDVLEGLKSFAGNRMRILYAEGCKITLNKEVQWHVNENPILSTPEIDNRLIAEAVRTARNSDAVLLVLGENELINREAWSEKHLGDRDNLDLVGSQMELARQIIKTGKPVAILLLNGRPLAVNELVEKAPVIIEGWYLGQETGHAVADIIFGKVNPSGKLTITFPRSVGQLPCFYNHKPSRFREYVLADNTPLFPFGFGLSYTTFQYENLRLNPAEINTDGMLEVSVKVINTGKFAGDEIVQLYIHDIISLPTRPVMELKDFARVRLEPGETKTVNFKLTPEKLQSFNMDMIRTVQPGDFEIMVGKSSVEYLADTLSVK
jgi:beta-glucosidase